MMAQVLAAEVRGSANTVDISNQTDCQIRRAGHKGRQAHSKMGIGMGRKGPIELIGQMRLIGLICPIGPIRPIPFCLFHSPLTRTKRIHHTLNPGFGSRFDVDQVSGLNERGRRRDRRAIARFEGPAL